LPELPRPYAPGFWETPRNIAALAALVAIIAAIIGFDFGRTLASRSQPSIIINCPSQQHT
jgi:hypothetical protein